MRRLFFTRYNSGIFLRFKAFYMFTYVFIYPDIKNALRRIFARFKYTYIVVYTVKTHKNSILRRFNYDLV